MVYMFHFHIWQRDATRVDGLRRCCFSSVLIDRGHCKVFREEIQELRRWWCCKQCQSNVFIFFSLPFPQFCGSRKCVCGSQSRRIWLIRQARFILPYTCTAVTKTLFFFACSLSTHKSVICLRARLGLILGLFKAVLSSQVCFLQAHRLDTPPPPPPPPFSFCILWNLSAYSL